MSFEPTYVFFTRFSLSIKKCFASCEHLLIAFYFILFIYKFILFSITISFRPFQSDTFNHLHFSLILIGFSGRKTVAPPNTGSISLSLVRETSKLPKIFAKMLFISNMANFCPGHVRAPNENGKYENGIWLSKNRSGRNDSLSSYDLELRLMRNNGMMIVDPLGTTRPLAGKSNNMKINLRRLIE